MSFVGLQFQVIDQKVHLSSRGTEMDVVDCLVLIAEVQEQETDFLACYSCEEADLYTEAH